MSDRHSYGKPEEGDDSGKDQLLLFLRFFAVTNGKFCAGYQVLRQRAALETAEILINRQPAAVPWDRERMIKGGSLYFSMMTNIDNRPVLM